MIDRSDIIERLYEVEDPELGMNIIDLGLVYNVRQDSGKIFIDVSLTYPGCPFGPIIIESIQKKLTGTGEVQVKIIWEPPWNQNMIAEETLEELRFAGRIR
ncbi:MAG: DUF59 domain-containing protein [Candidatus Kerfeldbacteria bacterium]|nr:DUF59 domain-containing protein [Candidatus Kerfeldbacteria bacterium]